jgi:hypothetical protein
MSAGTGSGSEVMDTQILSLERLFVRLQSIITPIPTLFPRADSSLLRLVTVMCAVL